MAGASPYMTDADLVSGSPSSVQLAISPNSPFDSYDFDLPHHPRPPNTPSYNGSYQNSPYTTLSELSYSGQDDLGLFDPAANHPAANLARHHPRDDYDPAEYDGGNATGGLLLFDPSMMDGVDASNPHISLAVTPPADSPYDPHGSPYNHSSPGSDSGRRSRASSVASSHHSGGGGGGPPDFSAQFEGLSVDGSAQLSPEARSPPRLVIMETSPSGSNFPSPPAIVAPAGEGSNGLSGPSVHVVPATPVGGGVGVQRGAPYQSMGPLRQGRSDVWQPQSTDSFGFQPGPPAGALGLGAQGFDAGGPHDFLNLHGPAPPRGRSLSETSIRSGQLWTIAPDDGSAVSDDYGAMGHGGGGGGGPADFTPGSSPGGSTASFHTASVGRPPAMTHHYNSYGPPGTGVGGGGSPHLSPMHVHAGLPLAPSPHLSPHQQPQHFLDVPGAGQLRRANSAGGGGNGLRPGHRPTRSEDIMRPCAGSTLAPHNMYPNAFLGPMDAMQPVRHMRRASSGSTGSRSERGLGAAGGGMYDGLLGAPSPGSGSASWAGSTRSSPYPSPHVSPARGYEPLPNVSGIGRAGIVRPELDLGGLGPGPSGMMHPGGGGGGAAVRKENVTTHATKAASEIRRKAAPNFTCPVPGCGSTFTRHFNLKGHMRSHNEEKPFQCKWPGCTKSFARQHDCKRHENLHLNIRPFTCEGCKKTFARMDALNRHLRSEGGTECQKVQAEVGPPNVGPHGVGLDDDDQPHHGGPNLVLDAFSVGGGGGMLPTKAEPHELGGWSGGGGLVM